MSPDGGGDWCAFADSRAGDAGWGDAWATALSTECKTPVLATELFDGEVLDLRIYDRGAHGPRLAVLGNYDDADAATWPVTEMGSWEPYLARGVPASAMRDAMSYRALDVAALLGPISRALGIHGDLAMGHVGALAAFAPSDGFRWLCFRRPGASRAWDEIRIRAHRD